MSTPAKSRGFWLFTAIICVMTLAAIGPVRAENRQYPSNLPQKTSDQKTPISREATAEAQRERIRRSNASAERTLNAAINVKGVNQATTARVASNGAIILSK